MPFLISAWEGRRRFYRDAGPPATMSAVTETIRWLSPTPALQAPRSRQFHRNLIDNLDLKSLQRRHPSRVIGQESYALQIQIGKNLGSEADVAMRLALAFRKRRQTPFPVKRQEGLVTYFFRRKPLRRSGAGRSMPPDLPRQSSLTKLLKSGGSRTPSLQKHLPAGSERAFAPTPASTNR